MQTQDRCGIVCDFCHMTERYDFTYYSLNAHKVRQFDGRKPSIDQILTTLVDKSFDMCAKCYDNISGDVVKTYSKNMNNKTGIVKRFCELSGSNLMMADMFYYVVFSKVTVMTSNQPIVCVKCNKAAKTEKSICVCGSNNFRRQANIDVRNRELEISISNTIYNKWSENVAKEAPTVSWSSTS